MVTETEIVALSVCDSVTCGVRPCSIVRTAATACESFGSLRSNVKVAESVTVSAGLKSQEEFCVVMGMAFLSHGGKGSYSSSGINPLLQNILAEHQIGRASCRERV